MILGTISLEASASERPVQLLCLNNTPKKAARDGKFLVSLVIDHDSDDAVLFGYASAKAI